MSLSIQFGEELTGDAGGAAVSEVLPVSRAQIRRWVLAALEHDAELVLRFVGPQEGRSLNHQYRGRDKATNVLTFDYAPPPQVVADIVICMDVVRAEAHRAGIALSDHLAHLVIHGTLHAQGHDHEDHAEAARMEAREVEILKRFRIRDPYDGN